MSEKTPENIQQAQVAPVPATPAPAKVETAPVEAAPVVSPAEDVSKKQTAAFIKMRMENRELKRKMAAIPPTPPPATPAPAEVAQPEVKKEVPPVPAPIKAEVDIEAESVKAIESLGQDKDVASVPGAVMDIVEMVDNDPRLARLHNIDPVLAFREAKALWLNKAGITSAPPIPKPNTQSGGVVKGEEDLESLIAKAKSLTPGTKAFSDTAQKIRAAMAQRK